MPKESLNKGILYVATGLKYVKEAIVAAESCKKYNNYPIALITDSSEHRLPEGLFDIIILKSAYYDYRDKLLIRYSPFENTIFLDTDTYVADSLNDLFRILDYREFAIHQQDEGYEFEMPEVSSAMPEFNTGVIAFKLTDEVLRLIDCWEASFITNTKVVTDQYHLRKTLYASNVRYATFSAAYNFVIYYNNFATQPVKILHGRPAELLPVIANDLNYIRHGYGWRRMYFPYNKRFAIIYSNLVNKDIMKLIRFHSRALLANIYRKAKPVKRVSN